jgi:glycosyltransferase involved in cell wall biosynthesis
MVTEPVPTHAAGAKGLKVLISAYACEPGKGSEPGVGWEYAKRLANWAEVWVVTRTNNRAAIEGELARRPIENLQMVFIDLPQWARFWKVGIRGMHLYYCLWQILLLKKIRELHRIHHFDILHHLTFGNIWLPILSPLADIPFIWGPIGGGETVPSTFAKHFAASARLQECLRGCIVGTIRFNPGFRYCCRKARAIVVKTEQTAALVPAIYRGKVIQMTDVGISMDSRGDSESSRDRGTQVRIICVGTLGYWRGFDIAIRAFARTRRALDAVTLTIVGDGPEKKRLQAIADEEGVSQWVTFLGEVGKDSLDTELERNTIFLHPCLKEGGVTILLEAMGHGMPVVSMDAGGVTNLVPDMKIPLSRPEQAISMMADVLIKLGNDATLRAQVGQACRVSVERHTWAEKARKFYEIYKANQSIASLSVNNRYTAIPAKRPRLLIPEGPGAIQRKALDLYNPYSTKGRVLKRLARTWTYSGLPLRHVFRNGNGLEQLGISDALQPIVTHQSIEALKASWERSLDAVIGSFAFSLGTVDAYQKVTGLLFDAKGDIMAIAKIGATPQTKALVRNEYDTLRSLSLTPLKCCEMPSALGYGTTGEMEWMLQSPLHTGSSSPTDLGADHLSVLRALADLGIVANGIDRCSIFPLLDQLLEGKRMELYEDFSDEAPFAEDLLKEATRLLAHGRSVIWPLVRSHGDFTPWNMRITGDGPSVYDWECSLPHMPAGWDVVRFVVMVEHLLGKKSSGSIYRDIVDNNRYGSVFEQYSRYTSLAIPDRTLLATLFFLEFAFDLGRRTIVLRSRPFDG